MMATHPDVNSTGTIQKTDEEPRDFVGSNKSFLWRHHVLIDDKKSKGTVKAIWTKSCEHNQHSACGYPSHCLDGSRPLPGPILTNQQRGLVRATSQERLVLYFFDTSLIIINLRIQSHHPWPSKVTHISKRSPGGYVPVHEKQQNIFSVIH